MRRPTSLASDVLTACSTSSMDATRPQGTRALGALSSCLTLSYSCASRIWYMSAVALFSAFCIASSIGQDAPEAPIRWQAVRFAVCDVTFSRFNSDTPKLGTSRETTKPCFGFHTAVPHAPCTSRRRNFVCKLAVSLSFAVRSKFSSSIASHSECELLWPLDRDFHAMAGRTNASPCGRVVICNRATSRGAIASSCRHQYMAFMNAFATANAHTAHVPCTCGFLSQFVAFFRRRLRNSSNRDAGCSGMASSQQKGP